MHRLYPHVAVQPGASESHKTVAGNCLTSAALRGSVGTVKRFLRGAGAAFTQVGSASWLLRDETVTNPRELDAKTKAAIDAVFERLPSSYRDIHFHIEAISKGVREKMARLLEPQLNAALADQKPAKDLNEARMVADKIDSDLCYLGLCAAVNGEPALLIAERGNDVGTYKYAILVRTDEKPWFGRALVSDNIPHVSLMPAPENFEHYIAPLRKHATAYMRSR